MKRFFSYDPEDGFVFHDTADCAKQHAQEGINAYRENAHEGWSEEVSLLCWGEIKQGATEIQGEALNDYGDYYADYQLCDV